MTHQIKACGNKTASFILNGIFLVVVFCVVFFFAIPVFADPIPRLSDQKFQNELIEMTSEYDKDVTRQQAAKNPYINERLIVKSYDSTLDPDDYGAVDAIRDRDGHYIIQFESSLAARRAQQKLEQEASVLYVEPDIPVFAQEESSYLTVAGSSSGEAAAVDWGVAAMGMDLYADYILDENLNKSITVAVLDTGISFSHTMISDRILKDDNIAKSFVKNFSPNEDLIDNSVSSLNSSHGTHVAGIIVQCSPGLDVRILPVRVLDSGSVSNDGEPQLPQGTISGIANGITYAADKGAKVINISIAGVTERSETLEKAVKYANSKGAVVVVSAGNDGKDIGEYSEGDESGKKYYVPAYIPECIVVGSIDKAKRNNIRNYGKTLDVVAPGEVVKSSVISNPVSDPNDQTDNLSGTSMAAPHVSAEAALLCMEFPGITPAGIEEKIKNEAEDLGTAGRDNKFGYGFANALGFVKYKVTFAPGDHGAFSSVTVTDVRRGSSTPAPPKTTGKKGYLFTGWSPEISSIVLDDAKYTAQWKLDTFPATELVAGINKLPSTVTLINKDTVESLRDSYDLLIQEQKNLVTNFNTLKRAEQQIAALEKEAQDVKDAISRLSSSVTLQDKAAVEALMKKYSALTAEQQNLVTNSTKLDKAEQTIAILEEKAEEAKKAEEERKAEEARKAKYKNSKPRANVTYRVPLKKKQTTKALKVIGLEGEDQVVKMVSSDKKKATVRWNEDGTCVITAGKKTGSVTITATCASGKKVTFRIKVQKKKVKTKKIQIASRKVYLSVGDKLALKPELYPVTSAQKITYISKNKSVVKVTKSGVLKAKKKGSAVIVIKSGKKKLKVKVVVN